MKWTDVMQRCVTALCELMERFWHLKIRNNNCQLGSSSTCAISPDGHTSLTVNQWPKDAFSIFSSELCDRYGTAWIQRRNMCITHLISMPSQRKFVSIWIPSVTWRGKSQSVPYHFWYGNVSFCECFCWWKPRYLCECECVGTLRQISECSITFYDWRTW